MDDFDFEPSGRTLRWYEWLLFLLLFFLAAGVRADTVYKCTDAQGDVAFQSQPCTAAQHQALVAIAPAPAYAPSPQYAIDRTANVHALDQVSSSHGRSDVVRARREAQSAASYECRSADGQTFYRHTPCPHSVAATQGGRTKGRESTAARSVSVSSRRVSREEACAQMRRAGAAGRSGREHDEDVSTYDKNLGRDPCR
jgi:hypothetical protein